MNTVQRIAKNTSVLAISQVITSILGFFLFIYIARYLGEVGFGKYSFALAFTGSFAIIANFGMNNYIIRELARNKEQTSEYLTNVSVIKFIFIVYSRFGLIIGA